MLRVFISAFLFFSHDIAFASKDSIPEPIKNAKGVIMNAVNLQSSFRFEEGTRVSCIDDTETSLVVRDCDLNGGKVIIAQPDGSENAFALEKLRYIGPNEFSQIHRFIYRFRYQREIQGISIDYLAVLVFLFDIEDGKRTNLRGFMKITDLNLTNHFVVKEL